MAHASRGRPSGRTRVSVDAVPTDGPVTVIVPAYNAEECLGAQLAALMVQDPATVGEIIIVDNGSTDRTRAVAASAAERDRRIRVVDAARRRGAAYARNAGVAAASGEFFAFCDADDVVAPDWARRLYDCARATGAGFIAGHVDHDVLYPYSVRRWPAAIHPARRVGDRGGMPFGEGCNLLVSRHAFSAVDGFDESLAFAAEDIELSRRLQEAGFQLTLCPEAIVFYRDRTTLAACIRQAYRYGRGNRMHRRARRAHRPPPPRPAAVALGLLVRMPLVLVTRRRRVMWLRQLAFWLGYLRAGFGVASGGPRQGLSGHAAPDRPAAASPEDDRSWPAATG